jgi:hypothetical protein
MRQPNPIATITATERIYALDAVDKLMVSSVNMNSSQLNTDGYDSVIGVWYCGQERFDR